MRFEELREEKFITFRITFLNEEKSPPAICGTI
jgi:hypothetical protein